MNIGILGTGDVGKVLAAGFKTAGNEVMLGTRNPASGKLTDWLAQAGKGVQAVTFSQAAAFGEVIVFAIGWAHAKAVIDLANPASFKGKVVLDTSNPLFFEQQGQPPVLALGHTDSAGEQVQRWLPKARVVKWFNIVGNSHMVKPDFAGDKPDMFICGNDAAAKTTASELAQQLGWPPVIDLGDISKSRYLEPLAMVWITHLFNTGFNVNHAFKLLRK
ncbi:MAG: NAD(P)-binding domain-containing protein [Nitrospirae bacterium]|nr:NAD(P)-binding domain-containing protein [Nitrospirota bacterium]